MANYRQSNFKDQDQESYNQIDEWLIDYISQKKLYVLRNRYTDIPVGVSYSPEGLDWLTNKYGRVLRYKQAYIKRGHNKIEIEGKNLQLNPLYYVSEYKPYNRTDARAQVTEFVIFNKAYRMMYNLSSTFN